MNGYLKFTIYLSLLLLHAGGGVSEENYSQNDPSKMAQEGEYVSEFEAESIQPSENAPVYSPEMLNDDEEEWEEYLYEDLPPLPPPPEPLPPLSPPPVEEGVGRAPLNSDEPVPAPYAPEHPVLSGDAAEQGSPDPQPVEGLSSEDPSLYPSPDMPEAPQNFNTYSPHHMPQTNAMSGEEFEEEVPLSRASPDEHGNYDGVNHGIYEE